MKALALLMVLLIFPFPLNILVFLIVFHMED